MVFCVTSFIPNHSLFCHILCTESWFVVLHFLCHIVVCRVAFFMLNHGFFIAFPYQVMVRCVPFFIPNHDLLCYIFYTESWFVVLHFYYKPWFVVLHYLSCIMLC